jgi:membrane-bound serine protease (ClpP class)
MLQSYHGRSQQLDFMLQPDSRDRQSLYNEYQISSPCIQGWLKMDLLQDPTITYLLIAVGLIIAVLALAAPGTGFLELIALALIFAAGAAIFIYEMAINAWALLALLVGAVLFAISIRRPGQIAVLVASITAIVLGSAYLFQGPEWWIPGVNIYVAIVVSVLSGGFFWFVARKVIEAGSVRPRQDLEALIGAIGEAKTDVHQEGSVYVGGELWSARSDQRIPTGARVRVLEREGFTLKVEAIEPLQTTTTGQ